MNFVDGMAGVDPSSDWNAPAEHWGNYEEPPVVVTPAQPPKPKEQPEPNKVSLYQSVHVTIYTLYFKENLLKIL